MSFKLLTPRLTELGKIKIGGKGEARQKAGGKGEWRLPVKYDYFVITGHERDTAGNLKIDKPLMDRLLEKYGCDVAEPVAGQPGQTKPTRRLREIPVALLSDEIEDSLSAVYSYYQGRRRLATCDGETVTQFVQRDGDGFTELKEPVEKPCDGKHHLAEGWKLHTTLQVVIAEGEARWGGVYRFRTTSEISADQLLGTMLQVKTLTRGILAGLPLRLVVRPMEVSPEGKATTVHVVHLELRGSDLNQIQQQALQIAQANIRNVRELGAASSQLRRLLAAPEPIEEQEEVAEEFHPGPETATPQPARKKKAPPGSTTVELPASEVTVTVDRPTQAAPRASVPDLVAELASAKQVGPPPPAPKPAPATPPPTDVDVSGAAEADEVDFPF